MSGWSDLPYRGGAPAFVVGVILVGVGLLAAPVVAQTGPDRLFETCSAATPAAEDTCGDATLAVQALHSGVGLLMTAGGPLPASPSTLGRRVAGFPRVVLDGGVIWASFRAPDFSRAPGSGGVRDDQRMVLVGGRATAAVGLFDGFSPAPTLGGVLSVDAVGTAQLLRLPDSRGFAGSKAGWGAGVRIGILRESFSLPGVTVSAMHYRTGTVRYGDPDVSEAAASLRPRATSIRAVVGRDLLAVGVVAGLGWDRYRGSGQIEVGPAVNPTVVPPEELRLTRRYFFAGANYTWLIAQLAGELTWARTPFPLADFPGTGPFQPGATELQGAVTVRIRY